MKHHSVQIWIDGDSCPAIVRNYILNYAKNRSLNAHFVTNKKILTEEQSQYEVVMQDADKDAVDNYILENAKSGDLIITKDIPFASRAIEKNICVINDRGTLFSKSNIEQKLADRDFDLSLAAIGFKSPRTKNYDKEKFGAFVSTFEKEMKRLVNESYAM